ncbi:RimK-like ATP-grasp domain family [Synechococcus sp. PCC 7335]|nr:RimK-like ATP-grasp domain family [Synechococcus sp. PCC 7335]
MPSKDSFESLPIEHPYIPAISVAGALTYPDFLSIGNEPARPIALADVDLVFCRTLKPFPPSYLSRLTEWEKYTRFVNSPTGKQTQMRAEFLLETAEGYIPDAIATDKYDQAIAFFEQHKTIVAKQSNSCGGRGVFKIWYQAGVFYVDNVLSGTHRFPTFAHVMSFLQQGQIEPLQFCRYLHRTDEGDKRVVVVDGEIYGSYLRRSKSGHWVNNVSRDGECTLAEITEDEIAAIRHTVGRYQALGLHTLGYDFLMDDEGTWRISEINAGNIGGFARLELLTGEPVMKRLTDWLKAFSQRPLLTTAAPQRNCQDNLQFA